MVINKEWFEKKLESFLSNDESNKMTGVDGSLYFEPPALVGIVSGNDPIFKLYKDVIGSFHLTPTEAYTKFCKRKKLDQPTDNLSVVAFILPINQQTKKANLNYSKEWPSEKWAHTRLYGEKANVKLQQYLIEELEKQGIHAIAPMSMSLLFRIHRKHKNGVWSSTWSHRHMCFASGLGSFGLSDGFLNERGIAMRCGSIIVNYELPSDADKRPENHYEYCTECGECIKRCPVGAISIESRHDKQKCSELVMSTIPYIKENYKINIYSCGLCQVGVPCENGIPKKKN